MKATKAAQTSLLTVWDIRLCYSNPNKSGILALVMGDITGDRPALLRIPPNA
jgi:hypothetical protein